MPGRRCLSPLDVQEPYDILAVSACGLSGPKIYVKEHLAPALYLPFQLDLKGVPRAQKQTIHLLLGGFGARRRSELAPNESYLAALTLLVCFAAFFFFVLTHET